MSSIKMQSQVQAAEIAIQQLNARVAELRQVVDALTSVVEKRATEADEDRVLVRKLMEHVGAQTMKGSIHGTAIRRGAIRSQDKQKSKATV